MKKYKEIVEITTNRGEFNRAYKGLLERTGKIHCSLCKYHHNENSDTKWYGGFFNKKKNKYHVRVPNWKLVSKNEKQWMKKNIKIVEDKRHNNIYVEVKF